MSDSITPAPHPLQARQFGRRLLVGLFLLALFAWLALRPQTGADPRLVVREILGMGTLLSVSVYRDEAQDGAGVETALDAVEVLMRDYEQRWAAWGDGALGDINRRLVAGESAPIPEAMRELFAAAARYNRVSDGRFDPRLGRLVEVWGFDDALHFRSAPPADEAIADAVAALKSAPPLVEGAVSYGPASGVRLDFGAIAKGDAVDRVVAQLRAAGYPNLIINAGGNLRATGRRGERAWRIGIRHPRPNPRQAVQAVQATLEIDGDEAVVTSGDYERSFEYQGRRYHHLLDPLNGMPTQGLQAVTVVAANAALADAASTALFVAGPQHWQTVALAMGLDQVMVVDAAGAALATPRLATRLRYADGVAHAVAPMSAP